MKKKYLLSVLVLTTSLLNANPNDNFENSQNTNQNPHKETKPLAPKSLKIKKQEFQNINKLIKKLDKLSEREKSNRLKLTEALGNYNHAFKNFEAVLEIKTLTENMHKEQDCYVAYYRIKDLDKKLRGANEDDIKVYNEIKAPLQNFLANCKNLRLDLLKKYKNK